MKQILLAIAFLLPAAAAIAQDSNWNQVQILAPGSKIIVESTTRSHRVHCEVVDTDNHSIACRRVLRFIGVVRDYRFNRFEIRQIRIEHRQGNRALTMIVIFGGLTAAGGVPGLLVALPIGITTLIMDGALPLIPSSLVYRAPEPPRQDNARPADDARSGTSSSESPTPVSAQPVAPNTRRNDAGPCRSEQRYPDR